MYIRWGSTKYHTLGESNYTVTTSPDGTQHVSGALYDGRVGPVQTSCGSAIPPNNECYMRLPEGADPRVDVCYKCGMGIGAPRIDFAAEQARENEKAKVQREKIRARMNMSAKDLFD